MLCAGRNVLAQQQSHRPACTTSNTHRLVVPKHRAAVVVASTTADQARTTLRQGIAQQLTGPHFDTWLNPNRFHQDRLVIQGRRLWYYATLLTPGVLGTEGKYSPKQLAQLTAAAKRAFNDIQRFRLDNGGWRFSFEETEAPQIHVYGLGFALYALSTYYNATGNSDALTLAHEAFDGMYARMTDDGGIFPESFELDYATELQQEKNGLGHHKGRRTVNSTIHLLETLTAYHAFVGSNSTASNKERQARSAAALKANADLVVAMKSGPRIKELRQVKDARKPVERIDLHSDESIMFLPGHNVEATFLVHDAYNVLGLPGPDASFTTDMLQEAHERMRPGKEGDEAWLPHIFVQGDNGTWTVGVNSWEAELNWWAQMELLNALVHADQRLPSDLGDEYIMRAMKTWNLVSRRFVSPDTGALYETLDKVTFKPEVGSYPLFAQGFGPWKASYHTSRALVRSLQALCEGHWEPVAAAAQVPEKTRVLV